MRTPVGQIAALYRYPVKSMAGESLESSQLGWHGLVGDRRFAFRRLGDRVGFPWLSASKLAAMVRYVPNGGTGAVDGDLPTHVRTPEGENLPIFSAELAQDVAARHGSPLEMMWLDRGIFDDAAVSVIALETVAEIGRLADLAEDVRRFRPNIAVRLLNPIPFSEDEWVGGVLSFGDESDHPRVTVTQRDLRCSMVNLDPDDASVAPQMLRVVVQKNQTYAGVYGAVARIGRLAVGQTIYLDRTDPA